MRGERDQGIGFKGLKELSKALSLTSNITTLNLGGNSLGDEAIEQLASALETSQITDLNLWENNITDTSAKYIAKALEKCKIISLELTDNQIGDAGAQEIFKKLCDRCCKAAGEVNNDEGVERSFPLTKLSGVYLDNISTSDSMPNSDILKILKSIALLGKI